jgi:hypothetical protein
MYTYILPLFSIIIMYIISFKHSIYFLVVVFRTINAPFGSIWLHLVAFL